MGAENNSEVTLRNTIEALSCKENIKDVCHLRHHGEPLPSQQSVARIVELCRGLIFPGFFGDSDVNRNNVTHYVGIRCEQLREVLVEQITAGLCFSVKEGKIDLAEIAVSAQEKADQFIANLPKLRELLFTDVKATYLGDPAAISTDEVIYCYPAIRAISNYRIAHELVKLEVPIIPRMISEQAHSETGIDIHPAATIGAGFTIDHGTGIVVGATAIIGNNVKLYQGVTLGAKSFDTDADGNPIKGIPRHPIIGDNVVIYSNASILGRINIGANAVIGGNIWVTEDVAEGEKLVQAKANNFLRFKQ
ncbi:MAG: serine acetyltransferase [Muribaculaceae bacterium]|nr:serine acetyltransferase [Muribaculaceae bacterium]MBQ3605459.1 serine acetyltransferase [Muribaculaceae bacterium]MBQ7854829.1 serine acetyltransferase [Muribaculaceae bacterium]